MNDEQKNELMIIGYVTGWASLYLAVITNIFILCLFSFLVALSLLLILLDDTTKERRSER